MQLMHYTWTVVGSLVCVWGGVMSVRGVHSSHLKKKEKGQGRKKKREKPVACKKAV